MKKKTFYIQNLIFILQITISLIKSDDRWYLYKYSKLYNSYKFDIKNRDDLINNQSAINCIQKLIFENQFNHEKLKTCGENIISKDEFERINNNDKNYFKNNQNKLCISGYKTLEGSYMACNYKEKSKIIAVSLEIIGLGFGHLYLQNYLFFFVKFLLSYLFCYMIVGVIFFVGALSDSNVSIETQKRSQKIVTWILPVYCAIYFADIFTILLGVRLDSNGQALSG
jgi:hypothetical protein